jgi:hypothetical protein
MLGNPYTSLLFAYTTMDEAQEEQRLLRDSGIDSSIDWQHPGLNNNRPEFRGMYCLLVRPENEEKALGILDSDDVEQDGIDASATDPVCPKCKSTNLEECRHIWTYIMKNSLTIQTIALIICFTIYVLCIFWHTSNSLWVYLFGVSFGGTIGLVPFTLITWINRHLPDRIKFDHFLWEGRNSLQGLLFVVLLLLTEVLLKWITHSLRGDL